MNISLIRHTKVYNPHNICYGQQEIALPSTFENDAEPILIHTSTIADCIVFSSPALRCMDLAGMCFPNHTIHADNRLLEMDFGTWQGKRWSELADESRRFYELFTPQTPFPQGESFVDVYFRIQNFFTEIEAGIDTNIVVFSHGGTIRACLSYLQHIPLEQACMLPIEYGQIFTHIQ